MGGRGRPGWCAVLVVAGLCLVPSSGHASRAWITTPPGCYRDQCWPEVRYIADPGEPNRVTASHTDEETIVIEDPGAAIEAGDRCKSVDAHTVSCTSGALRQVVVAAGDGADTVTIRGIRGRVNGGSGDDALTAGALGSVLNGGGGHDRLIGGAFEDRLTDGDGVGGAPIDADVLEGGGGKDTVSYRLRNAPITIRLPDTPQAGERGEGDRLASVEAVVGGASDDFVVGSSGPDELEGGRGDDRLAGRGGPDRLFGGRGSDLLRGGAGDDLLDAWEDESDLAGRSRTRAADRILCGSGRDGVGDPTALDFVAPDCERFGAYPFAEDDLHMRLPLRSYRSVIAFYDFYCARASRCAYRMTVSALPRPGRLPTLLGRTSISFGRRGPRGRLRGLRLSSRGARLLRDRGRLRVLISVLEQKTDGTYRGGEFQTLLRRPTRPR